MADGQIDDVNIVTHARAIRCVVIRAPNIQIVTATNCYLCDKWKQIVGDALGVFPNEDTYLGLILVHAALGAPFVLTTVLATLQSFNHNLVRASLSLGASPLETFFRITLPIIAPGVISGALFAFATSFDEVVVTLFIAGPTQVTLPRQMFTGIRENITPTIAAVATLLIIFTSTLMLLLEWLRGRRH